MRTYETARTDADTRATSLPSGPAAVPRMRTVSSPGAAVVARLGARIAQYGVASILLAIGMLKFTAAEAHGIVPLVTTSPFLRWMYAVWSIEGASRVIGIVEIIAALGIASRAVSVRAAIVGSTLAVATFIVTLSFFLTAPGVWDAALGFPFLGGTGQFIVKDIVLLGASMWALGESLGSARRG